MAGLVRSNGVDNGTAMRHFLIEQSERHFLKWSEHLFF